jgi:hypothetical protein
MKTYDIQNDFFNDVLTSKNIQDPNKEIYNELILFRFIEVINSTFPIYSKYLKKEILENKIKDFIKYGAKTSFVWQVSFEFKKYLETQVTLTKIEKEILSFESRQILIYISSKNVKAKKISNQRAYKLSSNASIQKHNFDIVSESFNKIKPKYYLIYKDINDFDVYYIELSSFLYYFLKYQRNSNTINDAIYLSAKRVKLNFSDAKQISKNVIENFINTAILV